MIIIDSHCDSPSQMLRLRDFSLDNHHAQVDFPKMRRGGIGGSFFALYVPASLEGESATRHAYALLRETQRQVAANSGEVAFAFSKADVENNSNNGLISILLGLENGSAIQHDYSILEYLYSSGVRYVTLTHSQDNQICDSCTGKGSWGGLSPFGRETVRRMNSLGMMVDLAHCSDNTVRDCLETSYAPIVYTHGCCRALCNHRRNLPDDLIRSIAEKGGVLGMSIYPFFLDDESQRIFDESGLKNKSGIEDEFIADPSNPAKRLAWENLQDELARLPMPGVDRVVDHIEHAVELAGVEHVGIGTDYDGIELTAKGVENIALLPRVFEVLRTRGFSENDIRMIAGENWLNVMQKVEEIGEK